MASSFTNQPMLLNRTTRIIKIIFTKLFSIRKAYIFTVVFITLGVLAGWRLVIHQPGVKAPGALLWSLTFLAVGALGGLLFGIPKSNSNAQNQAQEKNPSKFRPNDNLLEVSDWLTKVIVGAGLVQLKEIPSFIMKVAYRIALGINSGGSTNIEAATMASASIILYFTTFGFISGYIVTREILLDMFEGSSRAIAAPVS